MHNFLSNHGNTKHRTNKETNAKTQFIKNFSFIIKPVHSTSLSSSKYFFSIVCTSHQVRARHTGVIEEANNARHCECSWCINTDKPSICFCTRHQRHIQLTYSIRYKLPPNTPYCCYHLLQSGSSQNTVGGRPRSAEWGAIISNRWKNWGAWTENEGAEAPRPGLEPPLHFFAISDGKLCSTDVQNIYNRLQYCCSHTFLEWHFSKPCQRHILLLDLTHLVVKITIFFRFRAACFLS